ncbi:MAG: putative rRNA maturation factor [Candidatus Paceibacteria bacterium]|jgi:probable rRNA maturation factor
MKSFTISSTVKEYPKKHPYETMKRKILGAKYQLSLVFVGKTRAATLNKNYRKKTYSPNVLSFSLTEENGEIIICPRVAKNEAARFNLSVDGYIAYLFIHGLLHLKGYDHGNTMEKYESKYLKVFNIK